MFFKHFIFSALACLLAALICGSYLEYTEIIITNLLDGTMLNGIHYGNFGILANYKIYKLYEALYLINPDVPCYPIALFIFVAVAFSVIVNASVNTLRTNPLIVWGWLFVLYVVVIVPCIVQLNFTRSSLLLAFAGLLLANQYTTIKYPYSIVVGVVLFAAAIFTRIESGIAVLVIFIVLQLVSTRRIKITTKHNIIFIFISIALLAYVKYDAWHNPSYLIEIEPEVEYKVLGGEVVPLGSMTTKADSIKYLAAISWLIGDSVHINAKFMRSIINPESGLFLPYNKFVAGLKENFSAITAILLVWLAFLIVTMLQGFAKDKTQSISILSLSLGYLILPSTLVETESRIVVPLSAIGLFFIAKHQLVSLNFNGKIFSFLIFLVAITLSYTTLKKWILDYKLILAANQKAFDYLHTKHPDAKLITGSFEIYAKHSFTQPANMKLHTVGADFGQLGYTNDMKQIIGRMFPNCGYYEYGCRYLSIFNKSENVLIISDEERLKLLVDYLHYFYNINIKYENLYKLNHLHNTFIFRIQLS
ncbi:MAG: hypothetical protein JNK66_05145 [Chitinophagales bacterium]|nr:hypothetical protein [Chitinophagales bacterium]